MKSHRDPLVHVLERLLALLESRVPQVADSGYVSPQQPIGDVSRRLWHIRRGNFAGLHHLSLLFAERGPLARLASANGWSADFVPLQQQFLASFAALNRIRYHGTEQGVELGDHVQVTTFFFRKETGRVSYLPGAPRHDPEIDFGGLFRVGVQARGFVGVHVDPDSLELRKTAKFIRRDAESVPPPPSDEELRS
jgi:hypothetical protein